MAISLVEVLVNPADNGALGAATDATIDVSGSVAQANDYVVVLAFNRSASNSTTVGVNGGQSWISGSNQTNTNINARIHHCRFNGTWSANPRFDANGTAAISAIMFVFRGVDTTTALDVAIATGQFSAPTTPFDVTIAEITTVTNGAVAIYCYVTPDDNTWAIQTAGWSNPGGTTQWRNTEGSDQSGSVAYKEITSAGGTGSVTNRQASLGGDAGVYITLALRPAAGGPIVSGAAALSATATLAAVGSKTARTSAALSAQATLAGTATMTRGGAAALSASATLAAAGGRTRLAAAGLSASATLTGAGGLTRLGAAALSAQATLEGTARMTRGGVAALSGQATLEAVPAVTRRTSAALSAQATLASAGTKTASGAAALAASATLTAIGTTGSEGASGPPPIGTLLTLKVGR